MRRTLDRERHDIASRLRSRSLEIEESVLARLQSLANSTRKSPETFRKAVQVAISYGAAGVERGEASTPLVPAVLLAEARAAGQLGISLEAIFRQYAVGNAIFNDYLISAATEGAGIDNFTLRRLLRQQAVVFDQLLTEVGAQHTRGAHDRPKTAEQRRIELLRRLINGEFIDTSADFTYDFHGFHLGLIATGDSAGEILQDLSRRLQCHLLAVPYNDTIWAWLGGRRHRPDPDKLQRIAIAPDSPEIKLAIGESGEGMPGFRLTHRQAKAVLPVALRRPQPVSRYADDVVLASMLEDDVLAASLCKRYLVPLERHRDGGDSARETLRAYFKASQNTSSTAAALSVSCRTVTNRLRSMETEFGRPIKNAAAEIEAALAFQELSFGPITEVHVKNLE